VRHSTGCRAAGIIVAAALVGSACASARPPNRFIRYGDDRGTVELMEAPAAPQAVPDAVVRQAVAKARAERGTPPALPTIESMHADLRRALQRLRAQPSPRAHVRVAQEYARHGVRDLAIDHFDTALRQNSRLAAAYDGRARIWRDWNMPGFAIGDAYRAASLAPRSPEAQNTLGTVLMQLGQCRGAKVAFERALFLQPGALYAAKNLTRLKSMRKVPNGTCRQPSAERPGSTRSAPPRSSSDIAGAK
jgi:Tfp pilus assembly protein PilF